MTGEPINLTDLREYTEARTEAEPPVIWQPAEVVLALIDAVEAARDWHETAQYGEAADDIDHRLREALERFTP